MASSLHLPSPLDPSQYTAGHILRNSPDGEMADTLSPLRERSRINPGLTSPRSSPILTRHRASSLSRSTFTGASPDESPIVASVPFQQHRSHARHPSPCSNPFAHGIPFSPSSSPLSPSPLAGLSHSPTLQGSRPQSPSSSPRQSSPAIIRGSLSQLQLCPLQSPAQPIQSHFRRSQGSPVSILHARTQSVIQQSFGNLCAMQIPSSPDSSCNRRASISTEFNPCTSTSSSPIYKDTSTGVKGNATPLNEAPIRWWGRNGWTDEWDDIPPQFERLYDPQMPHLLGGDELGGTMGIGFVRPGHGSSLAFREPFGRSVIGPGPFLDDEIRASFDGTGIGTAGFAVQTMPSMFRGQMESSPSHEMENIAISRAVPVPVPLGSSASRIWNEDLAYGEVIAGPSLVDSVLAFQDAPENLARRNSSHFHSPRNLVGIKLDETMALQARELGHIAREYEQAGNRNRRTSDASTHSMTSYTSCTSGPSQSQSRSVLVSPSQSHAGASPSLSSMGIGLEEAEREELRSRTFWRRRNSGSTIKRQSKDLGQGISGQDLSQESRRLSREYNRPVDGKSGIIEHPANSKYSPVQTRDKVTPKHGSTFFRGGAKQGDVYEENAQREGFNRAEKYVSLAITAILPASTIKMLSPVGEALVKARESAKFVGKEIAPLAKDTLSVSAEVLSLVPLPGLEEAAKALLGVWNACQQVDTNRLSCLRLAERCAALLYSVRLEINEAGIETVVALDEPVERLCCALAQIRTFLETQLHRPFLKRYVKREEISRELAACNQAVTDAASKFGLSVQVRTYHVVLSMANESKRQAEELHTLLSLDQHMMRGMMHSYSQAWCPEMVGFSNRNALGLTMDARQTEVTGCIARVINEKDDVGGGNGVPVPPPVCGPSEPLPLVASSLSGISRLMATHGLGPEPGLSTPTPSVLSTGHQPDTTEPVVLVPPTPTPTRAAFLMEETREDLKIKRVDALTMPPTSPMHAIAQMHLAQDSVDTVADEAALRGTLEGALSAKNDVEMVRCLQVGRGEIPEAAETLRRMLDTSAELGVETNEGITLASEANNAVVDIHKKFMQSGIEAMARLATVIAKQPMNREGEVEICESNGVVCAPKLPSWTITRYEVTRTRKIGSGFFSDVYLGHWQKRSVIIRVLTHSVSREAFVRHVELWNGLDHPNILPLYGASSTMGEKPWFFVSKFCDGGNLVASLKRIKAEGTMPGDEAVSHMDLLGCMLDIAEGMAYLHGRGILHGDLRTENVLVEVNGRCVLSDFARYEMRTEACQLSGQPEYRQLQWKAPEMLRGDDHPTHTTDIYAFAMCCVEILGMGEHPWATLDDKSICELVLDKGERPPIPVLASFADVAGAIESLILSCCARELDHRPSFASIVTSLEEISRIHGYGKIEVRKHPSTPQTNSGPGAPVPSTNSSPADEHYETASESMMTEIGEDSEHMSGMMVIPLTSPTLALDMIPGDATEHAGRADLVTQVSSVIPDIRNEDNTGPPLKNGLDVDMRNEVVYRFMMGSNHAFHSSLTIPLWSPTRVELGAVGYLAKPKGEFISLFNAFDPLQSNEEQLRHLPSMYGYGKLDVQKREDGKRSMAQRGLDAISELFMSKMRSDRSHLERIVRQYAFPLVEGKPAAHLCVEKTVHRYMDNLEAPKTWFGQHVDRILEVYGPRHAIQREDLILVVGTLDAPDWALFVSEDHSDGRAQFNVFAGREKGEPWGLYTVERAIKNGNTVRWVDAAQGTFASKVSSVTLSGPDVTGDTVMLSALQVV